MATSKEKGKNWIISLVLYLTTPLIYLAITKKRIVGSKRDNIKKNIDNIISMVSIKY